MKVRDLMSTDPFTVSPETSLKEAARLMVQFNVSGLPVVSDGQLVGVLTEADFLDQEAAKEKRYRFRLLDALFGDAPAPMAGAESVGEVMTRDVLTVAPEASLSEAARIMAKHGVKRLPVLEDGVLVGVIARADVVGAYAKPDDVIEDEIREDVLRRLLFVDPARIQVSVTEGVVALSGVLENRTEAHLLEELASRITGVVRVESKVTFEVDDQRMEKMYPLS